MPSLLKALKKKYPKSKITKKNVKFPLSDKTNTEGTKYFLDGKEDLHIPGGDDCPKEMIQAIIDSMSNNKC